MKLIDKYSVVAEIKDLYEDIDKCIGDLVLARSKHDQRGISDAHWKMETLMVNTQQVFSYILQHLEVKEVDLEKEIQDHIRECLDVKFPTTNIELIKKDVAYTAKKFYELGLKAKKGK